MPHIDESCALVSKEGMRSCPFSSSLLPQIDEEAVSPACFAALIQTTDGPQKLGCV